MSNEETRQTVAELVCSHPGRARVFEAFGIDYCCGGKIPLAEACAKSGADLDTVLESMHMVDAGAPSSQQRDWSLESMTALVDHIVETHHAYLRTELPRLSQLTEKVASVHGERHSELREVRDVFAAMRNELDLLMGKEETILFPMIKQIDSGLAGAACLPGAAGHCGSIENPIQMMEYEHENAGNALRKMRDLTGGFAVPDDACGSYRVMLSSLAELEADLHQHIHKENNILFPKAIAAARCEAAVE